MDASLCLALVTRIVTLNDLKVKDQLTLSDTPLAQSLEEWVIRSLPRKRPRRYTSIGFCIPDHQQQEHLPPPPYMANDALHLHFEIHHFNSLFATRMRHSFLATDLYVALEDNQMLSGITPKDYMGANRICSLRFLM